MLLVDKQPHDIRSAVLTEELHRDHLETKEPSLLDGRVHNTNISPEQTEPSQGGEEQPLVADTCLSEHGADSSVAFTHSLSQRDARECEQGGAQVIPCREGTDITAEDSNDTIAENVGNLGTTVSSTTNEETNSSEFATEQSDAVSSLQDLTICETAADDQEIGETAVAPELKVKTAEPIEHPGPRFRPYHEGRRSGNIVSKLFQPLTAARSTGPGCVYIFRRNDAPGLVKIGYTTELVAKRLRDWDRCGEESIFVHSTDYMEHYHRAEALVHQELAEKRRIESCPRCGKMHKEWFQISKNRAIRMVDSWAEIVDKHKLYGVNGRISTTWNKVISELEQEGTVVNAESMLRQYKQLQDSEASEDMVKMSGQDPGPERTPSSSTASSDLPTSETSDVVAAPNLDRPLLLEAQPVASMIFTHVDRVLSSEATAHHTMKGDSRQDTQQQDAQHGTSTDRVITGSVRLLLLAPPRAQLLRPPPSTTDVSLFPVSTSTSDSLPQNAQEDELALVSTAAVDQADEDGVEDGTAPRTAQKPRWLGIVGLLFTLAAADAYFGFYGGQVWILVS